MEEIRISAVSYLNSKPFIYGLAHSVIQGLHLELDIPSVCADKLLKNKADIGLVPVAIIPLLKDYTIVSDFCIGAVGAVGSVMLYSDVPLEKIENIYLDYQSRTSIALVKIIAINYWKIKPNWMEAKENYETGISGSTAAVVIGDRTFEMRNKFKYCYDLAEAWTNYTGLPFVFACWVSNKQLPFQFIRQFNQAMKYGVDNIERMINEWELDKKYNTNVSKYLNNNISYNYDLAKQKGMKLFLEYLKN